MRPPFTHMETVMHHVDSLNTRREGRVRAVAAAPAQHGSDAQGTSLSRSVQ